MPDLRHLRYLTAGGARNAADEWREMWNREVLPALQAAHVIGGAGVRIDRRPNGTTISVDQETNPTRRPQQEYHPLLVTEMTPTSGATTVFGSGAAVPISIGSGGEIRVTSGGTTSGGNTSGGGALGGVVPTRIIFPYLDGIPIPETSPSSVQ